ncbi:MAG: chemotaxis protein CheD [Pseudomonadota bacterium]
MPLPPALRHVSQGEVFIASSPDACCGTILGSCVATLIWDSEAGVGGLNHLLLPTSKAADPTAEGHEVNLMELLINGVLRAGASRQRLEAKVFGGARMIDRLGTTGPANAAFVERFLEAEAIPCTARSVGGRYARRLRVWPARGRVQQLRLQRFDDVSDALDSTTLRARTLKLSGVELL